MGKILVVGSLNQDFVIEVDEMPAVGETILGKSVTLVSGGKGANQAYAAGKLGGDTKMIGAVGRDSYGDMLLHNLKEVGVDTRDIEVMEDSETGKAFVEVDAKGNNFITVIPGANGRLTTQMIDRHVRLLEECDIVILQLEIPLEVAVYVKQLANEKGKKVILDPAPAPKWYPEGFFEGFDIVKPNETELQSIIGRACHTKEELAEGGRALVEKGAETVIVTLGGEGCLMVTKQGERFFPGEKVEVVDTTAAGDCFTAAIAVALSQGKTLEEAIAYGNRASAIAVTRKGAQTSIPDAKEVAHYFNGRQRV